MILVCPLCQKKYLVQANIFAHGPRQVRCAGCKHGWEASLPNEIEAVSYPTSIAGTPAETKAAVRQPEQPIPEGSNLPAVIPSPLMQIWKKIRLPLFAVFAVWALTTLIVDRQHIARRWTFMTPLYNAVDLYIYYPGDELEFDEVKSELKFEGGITRLNLQGKVWNRTKNNQKVPNIIAQALGSDGHVIQSWQIDAPTATLAPHGEVDFSSSINAPKSNVVNINLNFAEIKDDQ